MYSKPKRLEYIQTFIKKNKTVTISEFFQNIYCCEKTLRRDINDLNGITSFTHRGKYITLADIPVYNEFGIWFYKNIGFTKFKNSFDLIKSVINNAEKGITKEEIEEILRIKISKQIQILLSRKQLNRIKLGAKYFYLSDELSKNKKRQMQVLPIEIEDYSNRKVSIPDLVAVLKVVLAEYKIDMNNLKKLIAKYSLQVPLSKIEQLFLKYDLSSKKSINSFKRSENKIPSK
jgi:DNA polymerase III delta prime subunit